MKTLLKGKKLFALLLILSLNLLAFPTFVLAGGTTIGGTSSTNLYLSVQQRDALIANGDYIVQTAGIDDFYRFRIEIPPAQSNLTVDIWDADYASNALEQGSLPGAGRDVCNSLAATTDVRYALFNPSGTQVGSTLTGTKLTTTQDNVWTNLSTVSNPTAGHWEVRIWTQNVSSTTLCANAYGIRAHDGDPTLTNFGSFEGIQSKSDKKVKTDLRNKSELKSEKVSVPMILNGEVTSEIIDVPNAPQAGTEYNVYANSHWGVHSDDSSANSRTFNFYPYILGGCTLKNSSFDEESSSSHSLISRLGATATIGNSADATWLTTTLTRYNTGSATLLNATDYGIWTDRMVLAGSTSVFPGLSSHSNGSYLFGTGAPTANPATNAVRTYLPTDAGTAPVKSYVTQTSTYLSGQTTPTVGLTTIYTVTISVVNPEAFPITFSTPTNVVSSTIPGGEVVYNGNTTASQGSIVTQPAVNGSGNFRWNPGVVNAGSTATVTYQVKVTPTSTGIKLLTGASTGAVDVGTNAGFVDITGASTTSTGELCQLHVTAQIPLAGEGEISGRVVTQLGQGLSRVSIKVTDTQTNEVYTARTNQFGYFRIDNLAIGNTHLIEASKKGYTFNPQIITLLENIDGLEIVPFEE